MLQQLPHANRPVLSVQEEYPEARLGARDVIFFVRRYAVAVAACVIGFLISGQIYVWVTPSTFVSSTQIVIESRRGGLAGGDVTFAQYSLDSSQMESQIQVIKSEQIAKHVVQALDLEKDPELNQTIVSQFPAVRSWFGASPAQPAGMTKTNPVVRALAERLQARRIGQSYVIEVSYWSNNAEAAARICNAITAAYISDLLQGKINAAESGNEILERRINTLRIQGQAAEKAVRTGSFGSETFPAADARVITTALPPEARSWPRGSLVLAFSGLLGLFLGLFGAAVHKGLDTSLQMRDQVARVIGLGAIGLLTKKHFTTFKKLATEVSYNPDSAFGTAIRQIRAAIQIRQGQAALVCIGISSTSEGEGKTTLSANLAQAFANIGCRVLLIDGDVRSGTLTAMLAPHAALGLFEAIDNSVSPESAVIRVDEWVIDFLPARSRAVIGRPIELPSSGRICGFLERCRKQYDVVLIDLPAVETGPDARAICPSLDGMIFVVESGRLRGERVGAAVDSLRMTDVDLLGAVITKSPDSLNV